MKVGPKRDEGNRVQKYKKDELREKSDVWK